MASVELALSDAGLRSTLRDLLAAAGLELVNGVDAPGQRSDTIVVVDPEHFHQMEQPIAHPERIVLIGNDRQRDFNEAWSAGLRSVILSSDPIGTAVLAVLAASLDLHHPARRFPASLPLSDYIPTTNVF